MILVTIKLPPHPDHDPSNKKTGECPVSATVSCTDITGEHHTIPTNEKGLEELREQGFHITRVERLWRQSLST